MQKKRNYLIIEQTSETFVALNVCFFSLMFFKKLSIHTNVLYSTLTLNPAVCDFAGLLMVNDHGHLILSAHACVGRGAFSHTVPP